MENLSFHHSRFVTKNSGFSLHAGVACKADERDRLEKICRYIARPAIAEERLSLNPKDEVIYKFKKPWDDGTTAIKLTQMEHMERLAALVPRPKVHLTRFHGCFAPHYKYRNQIVPQKKVEPILAIATDAKTKSTKKQRNSWARLLKRVFGIDISVCTKCQGKMKIIAAVEDPLVIFLPMNSQSAKSCKIY